MAGAPRLMASLLTLTGIEAGEQRRYSYLVVGGQKDATYGHARGRMPFGPTDTFIPRQSDAVRVSVQTRTVCF